MYKTKEKVHFLFLNRFEDSGWGIGWTEGDLDLLGVNFSEEITNFCRFRSTPAPVSEPSKEEEEEVVVSESKSDIEIVVSLWEAWEIELSRWIRLFLNFDLNRIKVKVGDWSNSIRWYFLLIT